ncbi:MAG: radical SAM protein [Acidiferrobacterales bacterium]|nr:radical SAM protein [Acidiferrobacterales bacterium]
MLIPPGIPRALDRPVRLLLVNPRFPESFWSFRWALEKVLHGKRALNPPLGLATLAALCPPDWQVQIVDENVEAVPLEPDADIVGVCGMAVQFRRQRELLESYRARGYYAVAGGSYASLCPEEYHEVADTTVAGEAEYVWRQFCQDFERGSPRALYREAGVVNLTDSPLPRFDLLQLEHYTTASLQFSRGCPYRCEFCDIIVMFGRRPRTKTPAQIGLELDQLRACHVRNVFFVDDNLIGNKPKAKELLRYLAHYQRQHGYRFEFGTEVSLNLADDVELLRLLRDANFGWVFVGIESPDEASLKETGKTQNMRKDILGSVRTIYGYGIDVLSGFIVGFDNDTLKTFEQQYRFIVESGIQVAMIGLLKALPKTPLHERLRREQRLIGGAEATDNTKPGTNFVPKRMRYEDMVDAYKQLYRRLWQDRDIAERISSKMRYLREPVCRGHYSWRKRLSILGRFFVHGLLPGGLTRLWRFLRTLAACAPAARSLVVMDWIAALAMRDYIKRYFGLDPKGEQRAAYAALASIQRSFASCLRRGHLEVSLALTEPVTRLVVTLRGAVHGRFYTHAARRIEKLLRRTAATVSLRIDTFPVKQLRSLERLLQRLSRYGDRISLHLSDDLRRVLAVDLSAFHLVLEPGKAQPAVAR